LDDLLRAHPNHAGALAERGRYATQDGDVAVAVEFLGRAVLADRGNLTARHQYALALARAGRPDEAAKQEAELKDLKADLDRMNDLISGPLQNSPDDPAVHHEIAV